VNTREVCEALERAARCCEENAFHDDALQDGDHIILRTLKQRIERGEERVFMEPKPVGAKKQPVLIIDWPEGEGG